jgi:hypothetical protein
MIPLTEFGKLSPAEDKLIRWLQSRDRRVCEISDAVPDTAIPEVTLRASLVRELALGKVDGVPLPETGLQVAGAWIAGDGPEGAETRGLDLEGCSLPGDLALFESRFPDQVLLRGARVQSVFLNDSHLLAGLGADRLRAEGGVFLRGVKATGKVRLLGARLGGNLDCDGATFTAQGGDTLIADGLQAEGGVFLRGVRATGAVRLPGARVGGGLSCEGAIFTAQGGHALIADGLQAEGGVFLRGVRATGAVRLPGARVGGDLSCEGAIFTAQGGHALNLNSATITSALFLRGDASVKGLFDLAAAEIGRICDDPACWPGPGDLILERCRYGAFTGNDAPVDAASRIRWLALQDPAQYGHEFWPQPYEECARVLRESGHSGAARAVLIEKERLQRAAKRARVWENNIVLGWVEYPLRLLWDTLIRYTIRYGRQPMWAFAWLAGLWLLGTVVFSQAQAVGALKPNDPKIQIEPIWKDCHASPDHPTQYACFMDKALVTGYPSFNALVYSADTLIPVISFEMQAYWLPDDRTPYGAFARVFLWFQIIAGWGLTLLAVAGFSGLVKQDSK